MESKEETFYPFISVIKYDNITPKLLNYKHFLNIGLTYTLFADGFLI